jgi:hypothetical protein
MQIAPATLLGGGSLGEVAQSSVLLGRRHAGAEEIPVAVHIVDAIH